MSKEEILFLDPHEKYFHDVKGRPMTGAGNSLSEALKDDSGFYAPFTDQKLTSFFKPGSLTKTSFNGTLFRFPLRVPENQSELHEEGYSIEKMGTLLEQFNKYSYMCLLFLSSLESIELYERDSLQQEPRLLFKVYLSAGCLNSVRESRLNFRETIDTDSWMMNQVSRTHEICIENISKDPHKQSNHRWLVTNFYAGGHGFPDLQSLCGDTSLSYLPWVSVAMSLDEVDPKEPEGHIFCFLPLPTEQKSKTGLPVHVNGFFDLDQNRQHLKWPSADQAGTELTDKSLIWNRAILTEALPVAYHELILHAIKQNIDQELVYKAIPNLGVVNSKWTPMVSKLLELLTNSSFLYTKQGDGRYIKINEALFSFLAEDDFPDAVNGILTKAGRPVVCIPEHIQITLQNFAKKEVTPTELRAGLKSVQHEIGFPGNETQCLQLLKYAIKKKKAIQDWDYGALHGLKLLPLADGTFSVFQPPGASTDRYLTSGEHSAVLLPGLESLLVSSCVVKGDVIGRTAFHDIAESGETNVLLLNKDHVVRLLPKVFPTDWTDEMIEWKPEEHINEVWLETGWHYLVKMFPNDLLSVEGLHLLPLQQNTSVSGGKMFLRRLSKNAPVIYYNNQDCLSHQTITLMAKVGAVVAGKILPFAMEHQGVWRYVQKPDVPGLLCTLSYLDINQVISIMKQASEEMVAEFCSDISKGDTNTLKQHLSLLKRLPMFNVKNRGRDVQKTHYSMEDNNILAPEEDFPFEFPRPMIMAKSESTRHLCSVLNLRPLSASELLVKHIFPSIQMYTPSEIDLICKYIFEHHASDLTFGRDMQLQACVKNASIFRRNDDALVKIGDLFDPSDTSLQIIFFGQDVFAKARNDLIHNLRRLGMKTADEIKSSDILEAAQCIPNLEYEKAKLKAEEILKFLAKRPDIVRETSTTLANTWWIPVMKRPNDFPSSLTWFNNDNVFQKPSSLYAKSYKNLVGCIKPIADVTFCSGIGSAVPTFEDVVANLNMIVNSFEVDAADATQVHGITDEIYTFLQNQVSTHRGDVSRLKDTKWIFISEDSVFVQTQHLSFSEYDDFPPFRFAVPREMKQNFGSLLKAAGVVDKFKTSDYCDILSEMQAQHLDDPLPSDMLDLARKTAKGLHKTLNGNKLDVDIYLPDQAKKCMQLSSTLCYNDCQWVPDATLQFLDYDIAFEVADALGVKRKRTMTLQSSSKGLPFGQKEALTSRIKRILEGYASEIDILKELLQNADDAQATEIVFCLDSRHHCKDRVFEDSWKPLQGPALCVYNNKPFSNDDVIGIQNLGGGSKADDVMKTGQYGVGFNAVYHITDVPSFLTTVSEVGERLYVFDPNCLYAPAASKAEPGREFDKLEELRKMFPSVFECYDKVLKDVIKSKEGSLFRFPLRTDDMAVKSCIKSEATSVTQVRGMLESFKRDASQCLLFLNNIRRIRLYEIGSDDKVSHLYTVNASLNGDSQRKLIDFQHFTKQHSQEIKRNRKSILTVPSMQAAYEVDVTDSQDLMQKWLIVQKFGIEKDPTQHAAIGKDLKLLPRGGVAYDLSKETNTLKTIESSVFCTLPLPIATSMPVHINAHFALDHEARRRVMETKGDERTHWNKLLMNQVIAHAYVQLIVEYKNQRLAQDTAKICDLETYQLLFPRSQQNCNFSEIVHSFYTIIGKQNMLLLPVVHNNVDKLDEPSVKWFPPHDQGAKGLVIDTEGEDECFKDLLIKCGLNILWGKMSTLRQEFTDSGISSRALSPKTVLEYFKTVTPADVSWLDVEDVINILTYCKKDDNFLALLDGTPLLFTQSGELQIFSKEQPTFLTKHSSVVQEKFHDQFVHHKLVCSVFDSCNKAPLFKDLTVQSLSDMLPVQLKGNQEIVRNYDEVSDEWISDLWKYIQETARSKNETEWRDILLPLQEFCIIPAYRSLGSDKKNILVQTSRSKSVVMDDPENDYIKQKLVTSLKKLGIPILCDVQLPQLTQTSNTLSSYMEKSDSHDSNKSVISRLKVPEDILTAIEMRNNEKSIQNMLTKDQCKDVLSYFSNYLDSSSSQRLRSLPFFHTVMGAFVSLGQKNAFIIPNGTPVVDLDIWEDNDDVVFLEDQPELNPLWNKLNVKTLEPEELYGNYILQRFDEMTEDGRLDHLTHIKDIVLPRLQKQKLSDFLSKMKEIPIIPSKTEHLLKASEFYDWKIPIFAMMLDDCKFPHKTFCNYNWHSFLVKLGLRQEVTFDHLVCFTKQVGELDFKEGADAKEKLEFHRKAKEKVETIMDFLKNNSEYLKDQSLKNELQNIPWILVKRRPKNYPQTVQWQGDEIAFEKPNSVYEFSTSCLVGCLKPVADVHLCLGLDCAELNSKDVAANLIEVSESRENAKIHEVSEPLSKESLLEVNKIRKLVDAMYDHLQKNMDEAVIEELKDKRCIFISEMLVFAYPEQVSLSQHDKLQPYRYSVHSPFMTRGSLFGALGVVEKFDEKDYLAVLNELKEQKQDTPLSDDELQLSIKTASLLKEAKSDVADEKNENISDETKYTVYLPSESTRTLELSSDLCFNDCPWINDATMSFVHRHIPFHVADSLGVRTKRSKTLGDSSFGIPFGQKEKLTNRLQRILSGYPGDIDILKEMLQNADDAQATEIIFCLDTRNHPTDQIFGESWEPLQGPALCVYNNRPFTKEDVAGIQNLGEGNKGDDPMKTGQYGVGFNAVYHITDAPSFLTNVSGEGERLYVLDPNCRFVPSATSSEPGRGFQNLDYLRKTFTSVFECYDSVLKSFNKSDKGTLFRFPLRAEASHIKTQPTTVQQIREMMKHFPADARECLLFLNNIRKISLFEIGKGNRLTELYSVTATIGEDAQKRLNEFQQYSKAAAVCMKTDVEEIWSIASEEVAYEMTIKESQAKFNRKWTVIQRIGIHDENTPSCELVKKAILQKEFCLLPRGAVAYELTSGQTNYRNHVFCTLPLPQATNLPVHINGQFILDHEARRRVWVSSLEIKDAKTKWNLLLMRQVIARAYIRLIKEYKDVNVAHSVKIDSLYSYFHLFPRSQENCDFSEIVRSFYTILGHEKLPIFPVVRRHGLEQGQFEAKWLPSNDTGPNGLIFDTLRLACTSGINDDENRKRYEQLRDILLACGMQVLWEPFSSIRFEFTKYKVKTRETTTTSVLQFFKTLEPADVLPILTLEKVLAILHYCKHNDGKWLELLEDTPLLITEHQNFHTFTRLDPKYLTRYTTLLSEKFQKRYKSEVPQQYQDQFIHYQLVDVIGRQANDKDTIFKEFTVESLARMLPQELRGKQEVKRDPKENVWIIKLWKFLCERAAKSEKTKWPSILKTLNEFCIVPAYRITSSKTKEYVLIRLSRAKSIVKKPQKLLKKRYLIPWK